MGEEAGEKLGNMAIFGKKTTAGGDIAHSIFQMERYEMHKTESMTRDKVLLGADDTKIED